MQQIQALFYDQELQKLSQFQKRMKIFPELLFELALFRSLCKYHHL